MLAVYEGKFIPRLMSILQYGHDGDMVVGNDPLPGATLGWVKSCVLVMCVSRLVPKCLCHSH